MAGRDKGKSKAKGTQATLASFYTSNTKEPTSSAGTSKAPSVSSATISRTHSAQSSRSVSENDEIEDVPSPKATNDEYPLASSAPTTSTKKTRPVSDLPVPVLTTKQRAKLLKQAKAENAVAGPLDHLLRPKVPLAPSKSFDGTTTPPRPNEIVVVDSSPPPRDMPVSQPSATSGSSRAMSRNNSNTIIVIEDDSPERPRSSNPVKPPKQPHPFFQGRAKESQAEHIVVDDSIPGDSPDSAIDLTVITDTPVRKPRPTQSTALDAPWPSASDHHIDAASPDPSSSRKPVFPRRQARPTDLGLVSEADNTWVSHLRASEDVDTRPKGADQTFPPIPVADLMNPALVEVERKHAASLGADYDLWTTKYRPRRAQEVLGNELNAQYLKEWLMALELILDNAASSQQTPNDSAASTLKLKGRNGLKRPRVIRAVEKPAPKKRRKVAHGYESDWVVSDDDEVEPAPFFEEDEDDLFLASASPARGMSPAKRASVPPPAPLSSHNGPKFDFSNRLTNALLIAGPTGCGKTAAVYACAEELGWTVFEVNPGMGKRGGAQLMNLLDGVGKNHTITAGKLRSDAPKTSAASVFGKFFSKGSQKADSRAISVDDSEDNVFSSSKTPSPFAPSSQEVEKTPQPKSVNQSIILLEEVDLLFRGESGFWPAVIDIIKESRRPVIMTCNDPNIVPADDLPLQCTLEFRACDVSGAVSYLRHIATVEGRPVSPAVVERLYTDSAISPPSRAEEPDHPAHPDPTHNPPANDLRRALSQLQPLCIHPCSEVGHAVSPEEPPDFETLSDWTQASSQGSNVTSPRVELYFNNDPKLIHDMANFLDGVSYANSISQRPEDALEAALNDEYETLQAADLDVIDKARSDDLLGYSLLRKPRHRDDARVLPAYSREDDIALDIVSRSRLVHIPADLASSTTASAKPRMKFSAAQHFSDRAAYQYHALLFLLKFLDESCPLMPRSPVFLDYVPWITAMVRSDDEGEENERIELQNLQIAADAAGTTSRLSRTSRRGVVGNVKRLPYGRYLDCLNEEQLQAVRDTAFRLDPTE